MAAPSHRPIGVFDSGLGGLTVVKELLHHLPHENLIYVGDTARVPYGTKSPDTIKRYASQIAFFLLQKKVKAIVVACNSASAVAIPVLRRFPIPVIGVIEPGASAAIQSTRKNKIGVVGTAATVLSQAYKLAIRRESRKIKVFEVACPLFVPMVEEGRLRGKIPFQVAEEYLRPLKRKGIDTLVLGCTHYPLLKKIIAMVMGKNIRLIDSAEETAKRVAELMEKTGQAIQSQKKGQLLFYSTDNPKAFTRFGKQFLGRRIPPARHLPLENL